MQIETGKQVIARAGGSGLIVGPLGVRQEFFHDAGKLDTEVHFIRSMNEVRPGALHLTNYETVRDGKLDVAAFTFASLDEADVLRSFGSKTYQTFLPKFEPVPYRFVATATPSPNRYKELIHYAGYLGVMDTGQALTRFFQRNSEKAGDLTLYPHKEREFWLWVSSWAVFLQKPSDLGFSDEGYELPPLEVRWHEVKVDLQSTSTDRDGQMQLMRSAILGVQDAAREKRDTLPARIAKLKEIREAEPENHFLLWHDLEDERRAIEQALPQAVSVYGSQDLDEREQSVLKFKAGEISDLAAKPVMFGAGGNLQAHCHRAIFAGIGFKFRDFAQAIHRIQRFGQRFKVIIDIIYGETEREVRHDLEKKWALDAELRERMSEIIKRYGLNSVDASEGLRRTIGIERKEASGPGWIVANNDCVEECAAMPENSVDLIVTSIPFSNHYEYTPSYNDFGHTQNNAHFWRQMDFLTPQLLRILRPGRLACIHVKDRILFGNVTGAGVPTVSPFHAEALAHYAGLEALGIKGHGFDYMGMITVVTDVVRENNQTYRLGWSEQCKDGTKMGVGSPEYILIFHKPQTDRTRGYADVPVVKSKDAYTRARWQVDAHAFWRSSGNRLLTPAEMAKLPQDLLVKAFTEYSLANVYDYEQHVALGEALDETGALPSTFMSLAPGSHHPDVWHDVNRMLTLNSDQSQRNLEKHVCPLQFDIVDRLIARYSNAGEVVFDPFGGLFTVPLRAVKLKRRGRAAELNPDYFRDGVRHLRTQDLKASVPDLFATLEHQDEAA